MGEVIIKFCGAVGEVTGSKHLIKTKYGNILLDCGLFQGHRNSALGKNRQLLISPDAVDAILISHAHIDHIGLLPYFVSNGYSHPIYATPISSEIAAIMLIDSARLQQSDAEFYNKLHLKEGWKIEPLYKEEDAQKTIHLFSTREYNEEFAISDKVKVKFLNAGHVLGSAMILMEIDNLRILYSGDIGRREQLLLNPPELFVDIDYLIVETTYGDRDHGTIRKAEDSVAELIKEAYKNKSRILIPGFSLERTQEIIYIIDRLRHKTDIPQIPVYVDSPMSTNITNIFNKSLSNCNFGKEFQHYLSNDKDPFGYEYIHYLTTKEESQSLNDKKGPMIIISASGMCEGGRILHHLRHSVGREEDIVFIVGYQAEGTLGRMLKDGKKKVKIFGLEHDVYCKVISMDFFSAHAGQSDLLFYIENFNSHKGIFLVHGENRQRQIFSDVLREKGYTNVFLPEYGEEFSLS